MSEPVDKKRELITKFKWEHDSLAIVQITQPIVLDLFLQQFMLYLWKNDYLAEGIWNDD